MKQKDVTVVVRLEGGLTRRDQGFQELQSKLERILRQYGQEDL